MNSPLIEDKLDYFSFLFLLDLPFSFPVFHKNCLRKFSDSHFSSNFCNFKTNIFLLQMMYVMPSTSGRTMSHPRKSDKMVFFRELKDLLEKSQSTDQ